MALTGKGNEWSKIHNSIAEVVGSTALVRFSKIPGDYGLNCNLYGKCEFFNASGSFQDRIAQKLIENAESNGQLRFNSTIISPYTEGDFAIALASLCAIKGYKCVIAAKSNIEKCTETILKALKAEIIRVASGKAFEQAVTDIQSTTPDAVVIDTKSDASIKPLQSVYQRLVDEMFDALEQRVDAVVINGQHCEYIDVVLSSQQGLNCKIFGVLFDDEDNLQHTSVGTNIEWVKVTKEEAYQLTQKIGATEAMLCGTISGANVMGALKTCKTLAANVNCVVLLPDGVRSFVSKFLLGEMQLNGLEESSKLYPTITFDITENYDPEKPPAFDFQQLPVLNDISGAVGKSPLIRLRRIPQSLGVDAEILVKCEFFNAGGSVKDRICLKMVELAEEKGALKPGSTIIEPSSGNTGIGLALIAAVRGYKCIIVMPDKMSQEKEAVLKALGATVIRTDTRHHHTHPDSHIGVAQRLNREMPDSIILDQDRNDGNPFAHYETTAEEILHVCGQKLDAVVIGAGTGGTVSGVAKKLSEKAPSCRIFSVDPKGSFLADPSNRETAGYQLEGLGYDFIPAVLNRSLVAEWVKCNDVDSFKMARRLIAEEGILCGGSSGANVWAALKIAKKYYKAGDRLVVVLPDSSRNYVSKFLDDNWLQEKGFA